VWSIGADTIAARLRVVAPGVVAGVAERGVRGGTCLRRVLVFVDQSAEQVTSADMMEIDNLRR
jgi:hypothetical protein